MAKRVVVDALLNLEGSYRFGGIGGFVNVSRHRDNLLVNGLGASPFGKRKILRVRISALNERRSEALIHTRCSGTLFRRFDHSRCRICASYPGCFAVYPRDSRPRVFCLVFARARRSVFLRRALRFLTLSLPWLCPISVNTHPLAPSRHVVDSTKTGSKLVGGSSACSNHHECIYTYDALTFGFISKRAV